MRPDAVLVGERDRGSGARPPARPPRRVGLTSSADIEPETSTTSAIDACSLATDTRTSGRASAATAQISASSASTGGTIARQRRLRPATDGEHVDVRVVDRVAGAPALEHEVAEHRQRHEQQREQREGPFDPHRAHSASTCTSARTAGSSPRRVALTRSLPPRRHAHDADGGELRRAVGTASAV